MRLRFTPLALIELEGILHQISAQSLQGADRVRLRIRDVLASLADHPGLGARTDDANLRRLVVRPYPYLIFNEARDGEVVIVGIRHAARDPGSMPGAGEGT